MDDSEKQQKPAHHKRKHFSRKKWLIIIVVVVVLFAGGAISGWLIMSNKDLIPATAPLSEDQFDQAISDAQTLVDNGDQNGANVAYDNAIKQTNDSFQKSILTLDKATMYLNDENYDQALVFAKQAEAINQNSVVASVIAQIYESKGDKQKAIEYYQKTITLIDKADPLAEDDTEYYKSIIESLGGVVN